MSTYKNATVRVVLPLLKSYRHKNSAALWVNTRHFSIQPIKKSVHSVTAKINIRKIKFFHTSSYLSKVISFNLSDIGEGIREVVVREWFVREGDKVAQFENICEVQSDKASVTITSRYDGVVTKLHHGVDDIALVGQPLVDIDTGENVEESETRTTEQKIESPSKNIPINVTEIPVPQISRDTDCIDKTRRGFAIPSVRRLANEHKIRLADVKATGKDGRVLKEDILNHINMLSAQPTPTQGTLPTDNTDVEPIRGFARIMIKTMTEAMEIPHFVYNDEVCVSNLVKLREKVKSKADKIGVRITYLPFFLKATSNALTRYPVLNSRLDKNLENIIYNKSHNIGVAMDTPIGLAVPVIKDVQNKGIVEISNELNRLQNLGKQGRFTQEDIADGTFTFSNIGAIGGTYASPIILPPQRAIIAMGAFKKLPRFDENGAVVAEHIAYLSGAADHRVVDGATMAHFCNFLKNQIEEPLYLFLNI